jgi:hypothetical protein
MLDWLASGFQAALATKELDPGLFHRHPDPEQRRSMRIEQFEILLRSAIGTAAVREEAMPAALAASEMDP